MFHIGVATQHPPLPEPGQLSQLGISFIKQCLTIDPLQRPSAQELMEHPWMVEFREVFLNYEEVEMATSAPTNIPTEGIWDATSFIQDTIFHDVLENFEQNSPSTSAYGTPESPEAEEASEYPI